MRGQVFEALVTVKDLLLLFRVQVVDGGEAEPGSQCHLDSAAHFTYVEDLDDRATVRLLVRRRLDPCLQRRIRELARPPPTNLSTVDVITSITLQL